MRFADYAKIYCKAGAGGPGSVHFRREKFVPHGGPDGGNGGKGADIILRGNAQMNTILDLRYKKYINADNGAPGEGGRRSGRNGQDIVLDVPLGTVALEADTRLLLGEVVEDGQTLVIAHGGRGGLGNAEFKAPTNQTPTYAQPGEAGEEIIVEIELKLMADVGLVGFPNAGKSTILSVVSAAKPKIADYPFTTLEPNLGVVAFPDYRSFVMADIPGIIEDAHEGKGLGIRFLRHIERNKALLFVISCMSDINYEYSVLRNELEAFSPELLDRPAILAISQMDLKPNFELDQEIDVDIPYLPISSATGHNVNELKELLWKTLEATK
ncbi:GTPase ObgE [bacterium]|nr:MAG: GTPase ObgE [bacterium]